MGEPGCTLFFTNFCYRAARGAGKEKFPEGGVPATWASCPVHTDLRIEPFHVGAFADHGEPGCTLFLTHFCYRAARGAGKEKFPEGGVPATWASCPHTVN